MRARRAVLGLGSIAVAIGCGPSHAPRDTPVAPYEQPVTIAAPQPPIASVAPSASAAPEAP